ncbi:esterase FE4-like [Ostrinia nubilalis]|uniref:esterase FE4-like n=1 Tax=Ostrinia nubilalis TaxID=29057 RepID=UPI0030822752
MGVSAKWVVLWSLWAARLVRQPTLPVRVSSGWLRGSVSPDGSHVEYLHIPYASVVKRFQAPGPARNWTGTFEAIEEYPTCHQTLGRRIHYLIGQEDCLSLNVFTPLNVAPDSKLPVLVHIHGGGYFENSASRGTFGPEFIVRKDLILVVMNYRLYIHGFLCLGIPEAPGNAGMKDQVAALKWIQRNIRAFGGDPDSVTINGMSAGATAAALHVLSPMSNGLFHRAIIQSGSSIADWGVRLDPLEVASKAAKFMGFNSKNPYELYNFYMNKTDAELITRIPQEEGLTIFHLVQFSPCVETHKGGEEPFLTELPYNLLSRGEVNNVSIMIGTTNAEGIMMIGAELDETLDSLDTEKNLPENLAFPSALARREFADEVKKLYVGDEELSSINKTKLIYYFGDPFVSYPVLEETDLLMRASKQPVYSYLFGYDGGRNIIKRFICGPELRAAAGASHSDDMFYVYQIIFMPTFFETEMIDKMTTLWANFARYGDPTPEPTDLIPERWLPVTPDHQQSYHIDRTFSMGPMWYNQSLLFWRDIYSKYRKLS